MNPMHPGNEPDATDMASSGPDGQPAADPADMELAEEEEAAKLGDFA